MSDFHQAIVSSVSDRHVNKLIVKNIGGGCIHYAVCASCEHGSYFIKSNRNAFDMFEKEARGLNILRDTNVIGIPEVLALGTIDGMDYLCLSFVEKGSADSNYWSLFGESLANLHAVIAENFGLDHDNYIGSLKQSNSPHKTWIDFFITERLMPQLALAAKSNLINSGVQKDFEILFKKLPELLPVEQPTLLHGDLWSGNIICDTNGQPHIFDPAIYYGHREAELAFTQLFGGFAPEFYDAYHHNFPLQKGFERRSDIFNIYPLLVHVNLFGQSYVSGIKAILKKLV